MKATAIKAAKEAGKIIMQFYKKDVSKEKKHKKGEHDIGSEVDLAAEKKVVEIIKAKFPKHSINAEEEGWFRVKKSKYTWYVDALDGTVNFTRRIFPFCVSIGIAKDNEPYLGVVYDSLHNVLYYAEKGKGAYKNGKKFRIGKKKELIDSILTSDLTTRTGYHEEFFYLLHKVSEKVMNVRITQCTSLNFAYLAEGRYDLYMKNTIHFEDIVAGYVLVKEAGGDVLQLDGSKVSSKVRSVVAGNKELVKKFVKEISL